MFCLFCSFIHLTPVELRGQTQFIKTPFNTFHPPIFVIWNLLVSLNTKEFRLELFFIAHSPAAEHPLRFSAWLTISFNLNYWNRARRERRFSLILEIQLLSLQDTAMSGQKWLTHGKLVQWSNNIDHKFNHFLLMRLMQVMCHQLLACISKEAALKTSSRVYDKHLGAEPN